MVKGLVCALAVFGPSFHASKACVDRIPRHT